MNSLRCKGIRLGIAGVRVADHLDLALEPGSFWGLLGANGVGKTTLLKCMAGLVPPESGQVLFNTNPINELPRKMLARHVGMLQQHTAYTFDSTVLQIALTGRHPHLGYWQREGPEDIDRALKALSDVDLDGFSGRSVIGLSGGEARRLAFAALMIQSPDIMLLDEPTNHLDLRHQMQIMGMIRDRIDIGSGSAIAALHDVNLTARYCTHVLMLFGEGNWRAGPADELLNENSLELLYGCAVEQLPSRVGRRFYPLG